MSSSFVYRLVYEHLPRNPIVLAALILSSLLLYLVLLVVYRLYLSPLGRAGIPGSRLAAATGWYETYHDVFLGGKYVFKIEEWHNKHGPVIRISPSEVHIADPDFYDIGFSQKSKFDKNPAYKKRFGIPHCTFDTIEHAHHALRRAAISPFFAKQKITQFAPYIQSRVDKLVAALVKEYAGKNRPVTLNNAWASLTFDVITYYAYARSFDYIDYASDDFVGPFTESIGKLALTLHISAHFPWFLALMQSLPNRLAVKLNPTIGPVFAFHGELANQIRAFKQGQKDSDVKSASHRTVFHELLQSNLPAEELTQLRIQHEAASITGAGVDTTKTTLVLASFFILNDTGIYQRLKEELVLAIPDPNPDKAPTLSELEKLPYLTAVIQEALRMSIGVSSRLQRSSRAPLPYDSYQIPAGTIFSVSNHMTHYNGSIFPSPYTFNPSRWLDNPRTAEGKPLSKYLVTFSKGPRMCLGINLAWAELYIGLASIFRRLDLDLFETGRDSVDMYSDYFIPLPKEGTHGVRATVRKVT